jgi:hypothetical protein
MRSHPILAIRVEDAPFSCSPWPMEPMLFIFACASRPYDTLTICRTPLNAHIIFEFVLANTVSFVTATLSIAARNNWP